MLFAGSVGLLSKKLFSIFIARTEKVRTHHAQRTISFSKPDLEPKKSTSEKRLKKLKLFDVKRSRWDSQISPKSIQVESVLKRLPFCRLILRKF